MAFFRRFGKRQEPDSSLSSIPAPSHPSASDPQSSPPEPPQPESSTHAPSAAEQAEFEALQAAVDAWLQVSLDDMRTFLHETPVLLTEPALRYLKIAAQMAQEQGHAIAEKLDFYLYLLTQMQENGIDLVMDAIEHQQPAAHQNANDDVAEARINALLQAESMADKRSVIEQNSELLVTDTAVAMIQRAANARAENGDPTQMLYLMLYARLLVNARDEGIETAWDIFAREFVFFQASLEHGAPMNMVFHEFLVNTDETDQYQYLLNHPELISDTGEDMVTTIIGSARVAITSGEVNGAPLQLLDEQVQSMYRVFELRILLRAIRARIRQLAADGAAADNPQVLQQAVLDGYINWQGGLFAPLPAWLAEIKASDDAVDEQPDTLQFRVTTWREAVVRAMDERLAPAIVAACMMRLQDVLEQFEGAEAQQARIDYLNKCLTLYREDMYPSQWAAMQFKLATNYLHMVQGDRGDFAELAIAALTAALRVRSPETCPVDWALTQHALADAYHYRSAGDRADNLERALACFTSSLRIFRFRSSPFQWAVTQNNLGSVYHDCAGSDPDHAENADGAITSFTAALEVFTQDAYPYQWALLQENLGNVYNHDWIKGDKGEGIERAIAYYTAALQVFTQEQYPQRWASLQVKLGNIYRSRPLGVEEENLEVALTCFAAALQVYTHETTPYDWATATNNLGVIYLNRIKGDRATNLEQAIAYFKEALTVRTEDGYPKAWAQTQNSLGIAYSESPTGDIEDNRERAIACFVAALRVSSQDTYPDVWAMSVFNLGLTYERRVRGATADNIEQTIKYYTDALRYYTRDEHPTQWALLHQGLGEALSRRSYGEADENVDSAIEHLAAQLNVYTRETDPIRWANSWWKLGEAYRLRRKGHRRENDQQALVCYEHALEVFQEETYPDLWAGIQEDLGFFYLARNDDVAENIEKAIAYYQAALQVWTEARFPFGWARIQETLGVAFMRRSLGNPSENLAQAEQYFLAALHVLSAEETPGVYRSCMLHYAELLAQQGRWDEAHTMFLPALRVDDELFQSAVGVKAQDAIARQGRGGYVKDAYALIHANKLDEAATQLEWMRVRGLSTAQALVDADPQQIRNPQLREAYQAARRDLQAALAVIQQPEEEVPLPYLTRDDGYDHWSALESRESRRRDNIHAYRTAQDAYTALIATIRDQEQLPNFPHREAKAEPLLEQIQQCAPGYAIVWLMATPWGGAALGLFAANPVRGTAPHFAMLDLPQLDDDTLATLVLGNDDREQHRNLGGFAIAQNGNILDYILDHWTDYPVWDGKGMLNSWEIRQRSNRYRMYREQSFDAVMQKLHDVCQQQRVTSTFDTAYQEMMSNPVLQRKVHSTGDWTILTSRFKGELIHSDGTRAKIRDYNTPLRGAFQHIFLRTEIDHTLETLSAKVMQPLGAWLHEQGSESVTIIPCGLLGTLPLLACTIGDGQVFAEVFSASVAPSARSLLARQSDMHRQGVYTLGNPFPTEQPLRYGQAEALTLAHLGGVDEHCRIQGEATKAWLYQCLNEALVVDASCHGSAEPDYLRSSLYLADGAVSLADMLNNQIANPSGLRLLILSACQTAIPNLFGAADEARSLALGMAQAGVEAVIATLWPVDDRATYLLMVRFAQEWFPHMQIESPAAALARAQQWLRTVTWEDLRDWDARSSLPDILRAMPDYRPEDDRKQAPETAEPKAAVRGGDSYPTDEDLWLDDSATMSRYSMQDGAELLREYAARRAETDPNARPFAHPFYWAGVQVTGR